jgi:hypothetical protein
MPTCITNNVVSLEIGSFRILSSVVIVLSYYHLYKSILKNQIINTLTYSSAIIRYTIENRIVNYHSF